MYKVGDKVRVIKLVESDHEYGVEFGSVHEVMRCSQFENGVMIDTSKEKDYLLYNEQIELVEPTHFNFISKTQITEHLQKVITFYEDYTSDLLKETTRDYREDIIDLKETGYEYRLELDKILIQMEE